MRQRRSILGIGFLVLVLLIMAMALGSCSRSAEERDAETAVPEGGVAATESIVSAEGTMLPGETVVSAVTPATGSGTMVPAAQATQEVSGTVASAATPVPAATAVSTTSQPTAQPLAPGETVVHTVAVGETLTSIAAKYGTTAAAIAQENGIQDPDAIYVGQQLKISVPSSGSTSGGSTSEGSTGCRLKHTVKQGEWVWQIARTYGADPYDILAANGLSIEAADTIQPGTVLCIP